jgi:hypothetical protein
LVQHLKKCSSPVRFLSADAFADDTEPYKDPAPTYSAAADDDWKLKRLRPNRSFLDYGSIQPTEADMAERPATAVVVKKPELPPTAALQPRTGTGAQKGKATAAAMAPLPSNGSKQVDPRCEPIAAGASSPSTREICHAIQVHFVDRERTEARRTLNRVSKLRSSVNGMPAPVQSAIDMSVALMVEANPVRQRQLDELTLQGCRLAGYDPEGRAPVVECRYSMRYTQTSLHPLSRDELGSVTLDAQDVALFRYAGATWLRWPGVYSEKEWDDQVDAALRSERDSMSNLRLESCDNQRTLAGQVNCENRNAKRLEDERGGGDRITPKDGISIEDGRRKLVPRL